MTINAEEESWGQYLRRHWAVAALVPWLIRVTIYGGSDLLAQYYLTALIIVWGALKIRQWRRDKAATKLP